MTPRPEPGTPAHNPEITAILSGMPGGLQTQGPWIGRRQLFIRFAAEAETATMYTVTALTRELARLVTRSAYHSIVASGHDVLGNAPFLAAVLWSAPPPLLPVMIETDGQRPDVVPGLKSHVALLQVTTTLATTLSGGHLERVVETLSAAASIDCPNALVIRVDGSESDAQILRVIEDAHRASAETSIVIHPPLGADGALESRWGTLQERAIRLHGDTRVLPAIPPDEGLS